MGAEPKGFIFADTGDKLFQFRGARTVDATRVEAVDRFHTALAAQGGRYDLTRTDRQIAVDHVRATFSWSLNAGF